MSAKRGRPPIKPHIKQLIYAQALQYKNIPRFALAVDLKKLIEEMGEVSPTEETMMKLISESRNHPVSDLDSPWSLGCLAKYDIPPEALPIVIWIYEKRLREEEQHFTIREVLWIARLHKVIDDPIFLERFASAYALRDKIDWILGNSVYTRGLDIRLIRYIDKSTRAEFYEYPDSIHPLPTWGWEEEEELRMKLKGKGYTLK